MKFAIGQPVWVIPPAARGWVAAVVTGLERDRIAMLVTLGRTFIARMYLVSNGELNGMGRDEWCAMEEHLRPRNPDQHTPAPSVEEPIEELEPA